MERSIELKRNRSRAVVLLSGGMDSCVCAALAARDHEAAAVHVSYGQRTEQRERRSFEGICDRLGIRDRLLVRNEALRAIGGSALTDPSIAVPEAHGTGRDAGVTFPSPMSLSATRIFSPSPSVGRRCWEQKRSISGPWSRTVPAIPTAGRSIIGRSMKL